MQNPYRAWTKRQLVSIYLTFYVVAAILLFVLFYFYITQEYDWVIFAAATNFASFMLFGLDKVMAANQNVTRVPEIVFHIIAFFGGALGIIVGSQFFRHKTLKMKFLLWPVLFLLLQVGLFYYYVLSYLIEYV